MPGKKDYVAVKTGGTKEHKQERLILNNLSEVYAEFKESRPGLKVWFSKFASL
jgi:hemerythrin-like domain-containing protein